MDAVVYTKDDLEFSQLEAILREESFGVARDPLDGHGHYEQGYGLVVVALEGAQGMQTVLNWADRYKNAQIIWITSDPYFAGLAMERHIHDFIERPYGRERFLQSVRRAKAKSTDRHTWHFGAKQRKRKGARL